MLFMERMKKIELLVLKRDVDAVMRYLGFAGCLQLIAEGHEQTEPTPEEREIAELRTKVEAVARFLDLRSAANAVSHRQAGRGRLCARGREDGLGKLPT